MVKYQDRAINAEILDKLSLENRYEFLNRSLGVILDKQDMAFLKEVQEFCLNYEKEKQVDHGPNEDIYTWYSDFAERGLITRAHDFECIDLNYSPWGLTAELMRALSVCFFDPQLLMMFGASILGINPIEAHHEEIPVRLEALKDIVTGENPSCILITEPERGSDAVHQLTTCTPQE